MPSCLTSESDRPSDPSAWSAISRRARQSAGVLKWRFRAYYKAKHPCMYNNGIVACFLFYWSSIWCLSGLGCGVTAGVEAGFVLARLQHMCFGHLQVLSIGTCRMCTVDPAPRSVIWQIDHLLRMLRFCLLLKASTSSSVPVAPETHTQLAAHVVHMYQLAA